MKHPNIIAIMLCGFLWVAAQAAQAANDARNLKVTGAAKRVALVIGNDRYSGVTPLKNAVADASSMAAALERAGFEVTLKTDANLAAMKLAVRQFKARLSGGDEAVFFYAGHGVQLAAANYLLPVDITSDNEEQVKDDAIPLQRLLDDLQDQKVKFALAIIDACRDNPFKGGGRSIGGTRGLAPTSAANGQMVIFSAGNGQQALDKLGNADRDANGVFTRVFLQEMQKPGVEVHQVLRNVRSRVVQLAKSVNHNQMPALYDQVEGDFHFYQDAGDGTQVASLVPVPAPARVKTKDQIEDDYWEAIKDSDDSGSFEQYRKAYPKGRYLNTANLKITQLKKQAQQPAPVASSPARADGENDLWSEAQKGNSKDDYDAYLSQHPKGKYVALARSRIKKLQDEEASEAARREQEAWDAANQSGNEDGYQGYLKGYPNGKYAGLAQARIKKLQTDLAAARQKKLEEEAIQQAKQEREAAARQEAERQRQQAEAAKGPAMVRIPGKNYEMGKYHVTRGEFAKFVSETGYDAGNECYVWTGKWEKKTGYNWRNPGFSQDDTHPVACVNWNDAQAYASWLARKTGKQYRLPIESEWEYACYGGSQTEYCGGSDINSVAWYKENSNSTTHPVGQKQANGYGLYDMSGNLWQWMENKYDSEHDWRALRGGSWLNAPQNVRASYRINRVPAERLYYYGFRLARTLP